MKSVVAICSLYGNLCYGHYKLDLTDEEYDKFKEMDKKEQYKMIQNKSELIIDDYNLYSSAIENITVEDIPDNEQTGDAISNVE